MRCALECLLTVSGCPLPSTRRHSICFLESGAHHPPYRTFFRKVPAAYSRAPSCFLVPRCLQLALSRTRRLRVHPQPSQPNSSSPLLKNDPCSPPNGILSCGSLSRRNAHTSRDSRWWKRYG